MADEPISLATLMNERPNRQLYENNRLSQQLMEDVLGNEDALHGTRAPNLVIEHEKPEHRVILLLKMKGLSNREIAAQTGYTEPWISQVTRQPWFQERLIASLGEAEGEVLDEIVKVEAKNSIYKLVELRDQAKSEDVQARCAIEILNRHLGKPIQRTENQTSVFHVSTKLEDLDRQLREVEQEEQDILSRGTTVKRPHE